MLSVMARNWWVLALRGLAGIIFGVLAFIWPGITLTVLVLMFGAYALVDGVFAIIEGIRRRAEESNWWVLILEGIVGILAGVVAFVWPGITAFALLYLIAAWAIITGLFEIVAAIRLRKEIEGELLLGLTGLLSVLFGIALAVWPGAGALALVWMIAAYAIIFGVLMIILAFRLRSWAGREQSMGPAG
jgi:uncharacterized membrane protein HdeD (DUF308 family)